MKQFANPFTIVILAVMAWSAIKGGAFNSPMDWLMNEVYILPGIVIGLSFHEFAHAWMADKLGDDTPRLQGRLTVNPIAHVDPVGLIALIFVGFGWGQPVQINPRNFKNARRDELLVSIAGVVMNLFLAIIFSIVLRFYIVGTGASINAEGMAGSIYTIIFYLIYINLVLMIFNLLPIPPLDGFNVITEIFNLKKYSWWYQIYNKGFLILMVLILFNFTDRILTPCISLFLNLLSYIVY